MSNLRWTLLIFWAILLTSCTSTQPVGTQSSPPSSVLEPADEAPIESVILPSPTFERVTTILTSLGYQGVGLEHEDEATLSFLESVFSSPKARSRKIQWIYTGLQLSYDKEQQSLTLGENVGLEKTLRFIDKNVPKR